MVKIWIQPGLILVKEAPQVVALSLKAQRVGPPKLGRRHLPDGAAHLLWSVPPHFVQRMPLPALHALAHT